MKKIIITLLLIAMLLALPSCGCEHQWRDATCLAPKTCELCDETEGTVGSHEWKDATCIAPKTCAVCAQTEGTASSVHTYEGDTCTLCGLVQLTLDNYENYIDVNASVKAGDSTYSSSYGYIYTSAECSFEAMGNTHYKYNDVYFTIKFCHYDKAGYQQYLLNSLAIMTGNSVEKEAVPYRDATYTVKLSIAGNGNKTCELSTPWGSERSAYSEIDTIFDRTTYEVISVTGTVQEYK